MHTTFDQLKRAVRLHATTGALPAEAGLLDSLRAYLDTARRAGCSEREALRQLRHGVRPDWYQEPGATAAQTSVSASVTPR